jgi:signal transduction histidine kinase
MTESNGISGSLVQLGKVLLGARSLDETFNCLLGGVIDLGFGRVRLYICRRSRESGTLELVGAGHRGPQEERASMTKMFEDRGLVIDPGEPGQKASVRCLISGRPTLFALRANSGGRGGNQIGGVDSVVVEEDPLADHLLKAGDSAGEGIWTWFDLPLMLRDEPYGKFTVDKKGRSDISFTASDARVLSHVTSFAQAAIENAEARECDRVVTAAEESAGRAVADRSRVLETACATILQEVVKLCGVQGGHVRIFHHERTSLVRVAAFEDGGGLWPVEKALGSQVSGKVFVTRKAVVFDDTDRNGLVRGIRQELEKGANGLEPFFRKEKAFACFPLVWGSFCEGTLTLTSTRKNAFAGKLHLLERIAKAVAPRIATWRLMGERVRTEDRSRISRAVLELLDDVAQSTKDRIRTMLVALTSGHGFAYNSCVLLCRSPDGQTLICRGAIGFETRVEAEREYGPSPPPEYVGSLPGDLAAYLAQAEEIEARTFPARYLGQEFGLSGNNGPLAEVFLGTGTKEGRRVSPQDWAGDEAAKTLVRVEAQESYLVPVVFSDYVVAALLLDNVWTGKTPWTDPEHAKLLMQFCQEVVAPTLVMDEHAPRVLSRCSRTLIPDVPTGVFLLDSSGALKQSDTVFRQIIGGDNRGSPVLEQRSFRGTPLEKDIRRALEGDEVSRNEVPFKTTYGRRVDLDYHVCPISAGGDDIGIIGVIWDSKLARINAKERLTNIVLAETHSLCSLTRDLRECLKKAEAAGGEERIPVSLARALEISGVMADALGSLRSAGRVAYGLRGDAIDIKAALEPLLKRVRSLGAVRLRVEWPNHLPLVACDPDLVRIVFENIINNALDAVRETEDPGITVQIQDPAPSLGRGGLGVLILDNGPGLPGPVLDALQAERSVADAARQGGLGLAVVRALLETVGGRLRVAAGSGAAGGAILVELPTAKVLRDSL